MTPCASGRRSRGPQTFRAATRRTPDLEPHGTRQHYNHGCHCLACTAANAAYGTGRRRLQRERLREHRQRRRVAA